MKTLHLFFFSLLVLVCSCNLDEIHVNRERPVTFTNTVEKQPRGMTLTVNDIIVANDNGYVIIGRRALSGFVGEFGYWIKTDECGVVRFSADIGIIQGTSVETDVNDVLATTGGYLVCGFFVNQTNGKMYLDVQKRGEDGGLLIDGAFGGYSHSSPSVGNKIIETADGGFLVVGEQGDNPTLKTALVIKLNSNGNFEWEVSLGEGRAMDIFRKEDNSYGIYVIDPDPAKDRLHFIDQEGNEGQSFEFESVSFREAGDRFIQLTSGFYALSYAFITGSFANTDILILDEGGNQEKIVEIESFEIGSMEATQDGGFVLIGKPFGFGSSSDDALMIKFSSTWEEEWRELLGETEKQESGARILQLQNGGYLAAGIVISFDPSDNTAGIIITQTDEKGKVEGK